MGLEFALPVLFSFPLATTACFGALGLIGLPFTSKNRYAVKQRITARRKPMIKPMAKGRYGFVLFFSPFFSISSIYCRGSIAGSSFPFNLKVGLGPASGMFSIACVSCLARSCASCFSRSCACLCASRRSASVICFVSSPDLVVEKTGEGFK